VKALSVRQPFAEAIVDGTKDVEYRTRRTHHRGPLLIHASKVLVVGALPDYPDIQEEDLLYGVILGAVDVVGCDWDEAKGCWAWKLANPRRLAQPVAWTGQTSLWNGPDGLI
jgi:ASCH domain